MSYFPYVYATVESECQTEGFKYIGYGICVRDERTGKQRLFRDISVRKREIDELVKRCNALKLDPVHIEDVIEDFLFDM